MSSIAVAVRDRRRALSLRQIDLAELASVSERFVRELESGKETIRMHKLVAVLEVLGLELHALGPQR